LTKSRFSFFCFRQSFTFDPSRVLGFQCAHYFLYRLQCGHESIRDFLGAVRDGIIRSALLVLLLGKRMQSISILGSRIGISSSGTEPVILLDSR